MSNPPENEPTERVAQLVPSAPLQSNTSLAIKFLQHFSPEGPWVLTAIVPDGGKTFTDTFGPKIVEACGRWIDSHQGIKNLYFMVNPSIGYLSSKAKKTDVKEMAWLHVDVDPRAGEDITRERERILKALQEFKPAPTVILDSGGGYQGFWKLSEPVPVNGDVSKCEELEGYNQQLELLLGGDHCHNLDRIMRLPGTINIPGEKKLAKGRTMVLAKGVSFKPELIYTLDQFEKAPSRTTHGRTGGGASVKLLANRLKIEDVSILPLSDKVKMLIVQGMDPDEPHKWGSRSETLFFVLCEMVRANVEDDVIVSVIMDPDFLISASVLDKPRPEKYAIRQIQRARDEVGQNFIEDKHGAIRKDLAENCAIAIAKLGVQLSYDEFAYAELIQFGDEPPQRVEDNAVKNLWFRINQTFGKQRGYTPGKILVSDVVSVVARKNSFHPVRDYLDSLVWDGKPRIDTWLTDYCKAEDTPFVRAVGRIFLTAAARRVRKPGCKFDEMMILEGEEGINKSSALRVLAVRDEWFIDDLPLHRLESKEFIEKSTGRWFIETAELKGLSKSDRAELKAFLSRGEDTARLAYQTRDTRRFRQCVFAGTTNENQYLNDPTGNRRFWPVTVGRVDLEGLKAIRDQLWAEAAACEAAGDEQIIRLPEELWQSAREAQEERRNEDLFEIEIAAKLGDWNGKIMSVDLYSLLGVNAGKSRESDPKRIGDAMKKLGWENTKLRFRKGHKRGWAKGTAAERRLELGVCFSGDTPPYIVPLDERGKPIASKKATNGARSYDGENNVVGFPF